MGVKTARSVPFLHTDASFLQRCHPSKRLRTVLETASESFALAAAAAPCTPCRSEQAAVVVADFTVDVGSPQTLDADILKTVSSRLSVSDLCALAQVNKNYHQVFSSDEIWEHHAFKQGICKADDDQSWKWNYMAAKTGILSTRPFAGSLTFSGDIVILDPLRIFFTNNQNRQAEFQEILSRHGLTDLVVTYRGFSCAIFPTTYGLDETAFEVFRGSREGSVCADITNSGRVAVMPSELFSLLKEENSEPFLDHGVRVSGINGHIFSSQDGDFYIRHPDHSSGIPVEIAEGVVDHADVLCTTGGSWTLDSDEEGSDDEDFTVLTGERLLEAMSDSDLEEEDEIIRGAVL